MNETREDTGYMHYTLNKKDTFSGRTDKIRIEHLEGPAKGRTFKLRRDIAEDLIKRGKAREVK